MSTNCRVIATLFCLALISGPEISLAQLETLPVQPTRELTNKPDNPSDEAKQAAEPDQAFEVVMRGPVHEAFAQAWQADPVEPPIIAAQPPEPIAEVPPELQPEGNNIQWIPGYWSWDESDNDFIWISGLWRDLPVDQIWNPGQWFENAGGWSWSPGFWSNANAANQQALPPPPANIDNGPSIEAPGADFFYVPGNWLYVNNQYTWQAGYWCPRAYGRVWIPAQYFYGCNGFVFQAGFWDYPLEDRGVLFAPICFDSPLYLNVGWNYQPNCMVNTGVNFFVHLFAHPTRGYCFGDWYDCQSLGYQPWVYTHLNRGCYDPLFTYYSYRGYRHCETDDYLLNHLYKEHRHFADHEHHRPDRRFNHQRNESVKRDKGRGLYLHDDPEIAAKLEQESAAKLASKRGSASLGMSYRNRSNKAKQRMYRNINSDTNPVSQKLSSKGRIFPQQPVDTSSPELMKARQQLLDQTQARIRDKSNPANSVGLSAKGMSGTKRNPIDRSAAQQRPGQAFPNRKGDPTVNRNAFRIPKSTTIPPNRSGGSSLSKPPNRNDKYKRSSAGITGTSPLHDGFNQRQKTLETLRRSQIPSPRTTTRDNDSQVPRRNSIDSQSQMLRQKMLNQSGATSGSRSLGNSVPPTQSAAKLRRSGASPQSRGLSNQKVPNGRTMRTPSQFGAPPANSRGSFSRPPTSMTPKSNANPSRGNSFRSGGTNMRTGGSQFQSGGQGFSKGANPIRKSPPAKRNPK